jgi:hypothetical protein
MFGDFMNEDEDEDEFVYLSENFRGIDEVKTQFNNPWTKPLPEERPAKVYQLKLKKDN